MPDFRSQTGEALHAERSPDYQAGHKDAKQEIKTDLAATLRALHVGTGEDDAETLTIGMVRSVFAGVFGTFAADLEFGPEPTGQPSWQFEGFKPPRGRRRQRP